jgi:hypothetical protein
MVKLQSHVESLLKGNLEEAYSFFKTNMSNGAMKGHFGLSGNRVITVEGYEGSVKISTVRELLSNAGTYCVSSRADEGSRIAGKAITNTVRILNNQAKEEKKISYTFSRILSLEWIPHRISLDRSFADCAKKFGTYNLLQMQQKFPDVDTTSAPSLIEAEKGSIVKVCTRFVAMPNKGFQDKEPSLYVHRQTNRVMTDDETIDAKDFYLHFRPVSTKEMYTGFRVPTKFIRAKLNETQKETLLSSEKSPICIPLISPIIIKQIEESKNSNPA